jgi:hypothetical protein
MSSKTKRGKQSPSPSRLSKQGYAKELNTPGDITSLLGRIGGIVKRVELGLIIALWVIYLNLRHTEDEEPIRWNEVKRVVLEEYK